MVLQEQFYINMALFFALLFLIQSEQMLWLPIDKNHLYNNTQLLPLSIKQTTQINGEIL